MSNVQINFSPESLILLNVILAFMMFGVSLGVRKEDFTQVIKRPIAPIVGLVTQFILLPGLTALAVWGFNIDPELGLGMILVASCPGGTFSNLMTFLAKGNVAVSVSMTAVSSLAATVMTPFNFFFYGSILDSTSTLITAISISPLDVFLLTFFVLAIPLILGMVVGEHFPKFRTRSDKFFRVFSLVVLLSFCVIAFSQNVGTFNQYWQSFAFLVIAHNLFALFLGYVSSRIVGLPSSECKAVTLEVGIQNSGMGLSILFTFFPQMGGMLLITAFWGVWHLVSGLSLSYIWSRQKTFGQSNNLNPIHSQADRTNLASNTAHSLENKALANPPN